MQTAVCLGFWFGFPQQEDGQRPPRVNKDYRPVGAGRDPPVYLSAERGLCPRRNLIIFSAEAGSLEDLAEGG